MGDEMKQPLSPPRLSIQRHSQASAARVRSRRAVLARSVYLVRRPCLEWRGVLHKHGLSRRRHHPRRDMDVDRALRPRRCEWTLALCVDLVRNVQSRRRLVLAVVMARHDATRPTMGKDALLRRLPQECARHGSSLLNTCIGQRNYAQFFTIAMCGVVVFSIQAVVSVYAIEWRRDSMSPSLLAHSGFIVCAVLSVPCLVMYSTLLAFHIYLSCVGYGTYDYFLKRRDALRAERRRKRDEQIQATKESIDKLTRVV
ncbi:hypothetical protein Ae201684P_003012 [Aphanomyces euteiches]|nr:hypothetical protein Ae201684P_003012 [Aphanomyces euteiches]